MTDLQPLSIGAPVSTPVFAFAKTLIKSLRLTKLAIFILSLYARLFPRLIVRRRGIRYEVNLGEVVDLGIFTGGWEAATIAILERTVNEGDVVLEVGANIGAHTLLLSKLVGSTGAVHAFEPTDYAQKKLLRNLELNPTFSSNVSVQTQLVTNKALATPNLNIRSSWKLNGGSNTPAAIAAPSATTLDQFVLDKNITRLDLLKVDVDGYDFKVLQGAADSIARFKPKIFVELCEYSLAEQGDSVKDVFSLLRSLGYQAFLEDGKPVGSVEQVLSLVGMNTSVNAVFLSVAAV